MARIPRLRGLQSLQLVFSPASSCSAVRTPFAASRTLSTTTATQGKNTDWIRGKLWKGEPPGPEDPYTQTVETEEQTNLPDEALEVMPKEERIPRAVQQSRLVLPPKRSEALYEGEVKSADPTYVPASVAEGLEEIATTKTWWDQPGHWGEESNFKGFGRADKVTDKTVLEVYLRRAVVEVLALREAGALQEWALKKWRAGDRSELDETLAVQIRVQDGKATLAGDVAAITTRLKSEAEEPEIVEKVSVEEARELVKAWDASWKDITLDDQIRFAIRKRLFQLTSRLIPDVKLGAARNIKHILTLTTKSPKAKKLAEVLERAEVASLPNVTVHSRKVGPIDKEIAVGRWKVIEEELRKRDLPVTGTEALNKNRERDWISGKY